MEIDAFTTEHDTFLFRQMLTRLYAGLVLGAIACVASVPASAADTIEWEVLNRFRALDYMGLDDGQDLAESVRLFAAYRPSEGESFQAWSARLAGLGSPYADRSGPWIEAPRQQDARYKEDFVELPAKMAIEARLSKVEGPGIACTWKVNGQTSALRPCSDPFRFTLAGSAATLEVQPAGGRPVVTEVRPQLRIVLGLGDSYAAGQGSPDRPTQWKLAPPPAFGENEGAGEGGGLPRPRPLRWIDFAGWQADRLVERPAAWHSPRCDRSFWSYQNLVALHTAADDPRSVVAFVHLACSGAEVINGMLAPQRMPPGHAYTACKDRDTDAPLDLRCDVPKSQLRAAVDALCREAPAPASREAVDPKILSQILMSLQKVAVGAEAALIQEIPDELRSCRAGQLRPVDTVLLSIGGNDVGFAGIIIWALAPSKSRLDLPGAQQVMTTLYSTFRKKEAVCPNPRAHNGSASCAPRTTAEERIGGLPERYGALGTALTELLGVRPSRILLNGYPDGLWASASAICGQKPFSEDNNEWSAVYAAVPPVGRLIGGLQGSNPFQVNLTGAPDGEAVAIHQHVILKLNGTAATSARQQGWMFAANQDVMKGHGWCVGPPPRTSPIDGRPWDGLADGMRRIRTLNDSFFTQWPAPSASDRGDGLSGTFHPNLQGYAAMAEVANRALQETAVRQPDRLGAGAASR